VTVVTAPLRYDVAAIRRENPLADVVRGYGVSLRPLGRSLVGLCPLHGDRATPNLHVYVDPSGARDNWFCFRCMAGGDVVTFVMRAEGIEFAPACERLGGRQVAGPRAAEPPPSPPRWDRLSLPEQVILNLATAVYQRRLRAAPAALAYLRARGIPDEVVRDCGLGYADGRTLERVLRRRAGLRIAERLGLLRRPRPDDGVGRHAEHLAGRIVVPERRGGHCAWLIARWVPDGRDDGRPKYLGLAGERLILGWERVAGREEVFLAEGVFGYLVGVGWGLPVCTPCGTHVAADRLGFLARADRIWGLLDPDDAGRDAAARLGAELGDRFRPLWLPGDLEIDDLALRPGGRAAFERCLAEARAAHPVPKEAVHAR
jgi:DNA primase